MGIKEPLKGSNPRQDAKPRQKTKQITGGAGGASRQDLLHAGKVNANQNRCHGEKCSNQSKRDCDNSMCGRCCRNSQVSCSVHETDIFPHAAPGYATGRVFYDPQPRGYFKGRDDMAQAVNSKQQLRSVLFGPDFHVRDDDVIKAVELWKRGSGGA